MRSQHADDYNHDAWAEGYDQDVADESHPIRAGYSALLDWMASAAEIGASDRVLELGSGSGNLTLRLPACGELICVDISAAMEALAALKLTHLSNRRFIQEDILAVFDRPNFGSFDCVLSSYTVHHLTEEEKGWLFSRVWQQLVSGGRAVFGDLMVETAACQAGLAARYRAQGQPDTAESIEEEFFWRLDTAVEQLTRLGFCVQTRRFSDLSFGLLCRKEN